MTRGFRSHPFACYIGAFSQLHVPVCHEWESDFELPWSEGIQAQFRDLAKNIRTRDRV